jgi:hypothetical protein
VLVTGTGWLLSKQNLRQEGAAGRSSYPVISGFASSMLRYEQETISIGGLLVAKTLPALAVEAHELG